VGGKKEDVEIANAMDDSTTLTLFFLPYYYGIGSSAQQTAPLTTSLLANS
jgi:hypothetical protein